MKKLLIMMLFIPMIVKGISASSAIVMDLDNGRVLYGHNIYERKLIASTTKIMTAIIAIENGNIYDTIEVSDIIKESYGSSIYLSVGEKITLKDLLYGLMLRSGNDASLVIAEYISGSKEEFVYLMNEYASRINMTNTVFYNPSGLEENGNTGNISTSLDMAKLTRYAMNNPIFRDIFKTKDYKCTTSNKSYIWHNKNKLLNLDYITGGKTGYTELARRTLVSTGSKNNINLVVVTLNDPDDWLDHKYLYNMIFKNYKNIKVLDKNKFLIKDDNYYKDKLFINNNAYITLNKEEINYLNINYSLYKLNKVYNNDLVGYAEIKINNEIYHKEPIYIKVKEKKKESFITKISRWFKW